MSNMRSNRKATASHYWRWHLEKALILKYEPSLLNSIINESQFCQTLKCQNDGHFMLWPLVLTWSTMADGPGEWSLLARALKCFAFLSWSLNSFCFANVKFITFPATGFVGLYRLLWTSESGSDDLCWRSLWQPLLTEQARTHALYVSTWSGLHGEELGCPPRSPGQGRSVTLTPTLTKDFLFING